MKKQKGIRLFLTKEEFVNERFAWAGEIRRAGFVWWETKIYTCGHLHLPATTSDFLHYGEDRFQQERAIYRAFSKKYGSKDYRLWEEEALLFPQRRDVHTVEKVFQGVKDALLHNYLLDKGRAEFEEEIAKMGLRLRDGNVNPLEKEYWGYETTEREEAIEWGVIADNLSSKEKRRLLQSLGTQRISHLRLSRKGKRHGR